MAQTFKQLRDKIAAQIWPSGEPENLVELHTSYFREALATIQRYNDCLQQWNNDVHPFCSTYYHCQKTVIPAPAGKIRTVYTVMDEDDFCDPVYYYPSTIGEVEAWAKRNEWTDELPANKGLSKLPMGFRYAESVTDHGYGRARVGIYAVYDNKIWIAPYIQSYERVVVVWRGIKQQWSDADFPPEGITLERAVRNYVLSNRYTFIEGDPSKGRNFYQLFADDNGDLAFDCDEQTNPDLPHPAVNEAFKRAKEPKSTAVNPADDENTYVLAFLADYGDDTNREGGGYPEKDVADLIKGWSPDAILTGGDNSYPDSDYAVIDDNIGKHYAEFIYPYPDWGSYGPGHKDTNKFWPSLGNHDYDFQNAKPYFDYFALPNNERYYDVIVGPVHWFVINSNPEEPDGTSSTSTQALWLQRKLALSTVQWKFVVFHHSAFSSDDTHGSSAYMQWPFKDWGAHAVFSGHAHSYERIVKDGFPYFVVGTGGTPLRGFGTTVSGSEKRYNDDYGALKMIAKCDEVSFEFINREKKVIDTYKLT